ncbi:hypothetical protein SASPL_152413 [Salvia splendens]|uniref:Aminotransferase class V domain-containing protein n=1 Tax=Salvia splendens TaxID=180675 RepID=A0A8X8W3U1_SALSN|nr:hypothetical protein SASPL_152413 [Salvia splendens]
MISKQAKLVVVHHVSNMLGLLLFRWSRHVILKSRPDRFCRCLHLLLFSQLIKWAHDVGAKVLVDACQSVPHMVVDVRSLDADVLVASSHKVKSFPTFPSALEFKCVGLQALGSYMVKVSSCLPASFLSTQRPCLRNVTRAALYSFNVEGVHPTDIATFLDQQVHVKLH